MKKKMIINK